jgi:hypothetical protein
MSSTKDPITGFPAKWLPHLARETHCPFSTVDKSPMHSSSGAPVITHKPTFYEQVLGVNTFEVFLP